MWHPPENLTEDPALRNRSPVFQDRADAGEQLAALLAGWRNSDAIVCAVPAGGVPVAIAIARALLLPLDVLVVSKMTLPWNSEVGFGAMAADGAIQINQELVSAVGLTREQIVDRMRETQLKVLRREQRYHEILEKQRLASRDVLLVDDGLASGFTLRVAIAAAQSQRPSSVAVAVPTGHSTSLGRVAKDCDRLYCANVREGFRFAVADAYQSWADVSEREVIETLEERR